jgi:hypothetical protein
MAVAPEDALATIGKVAAITLYNDRKRAFADLGLTPDTGV